MVSNKGRVRREEKILKECLNPAGYSYANLSYNGKNEQPAVHEMVLDAFKVPRPKGVKNPIVKHKNNKKNDNSLNNLEWGSIADNTEDAYADGLIKDKGANNPEWKNDKEEKDSVGGEKTKKFKFDKTGDQDKQEEEDEEPSDYKEDPCWEGYEQKGMKEKDGKQVPNCTKKDKSYEEPSVPEGWKSKRPPKTYDEDGAEEKDVNEVPEGWQVKNNS